MALQNHSLKYSLYKEKQKEKCYYGVKWTIFNSLEVKLAKSNLEVK